MTPDCTTSTADLGLTVEIVEFNGIPISFYEAMQDFYSGNIEDFTFGGVDG